MNPRRLSLLAALCIGHTAMPARAQTDTLSVSVIGSDITTLDPVRATTTTDLVPVGWIYNALVRFAPGSSDPKTLEPDLAESWEVSDNDTVWTFHLRSGVRFQGDWGTLDADDVVYSLKRAADPKRSTFAAELSVIDTVAAVDPLTVRVTLRYPDANFLGRVANYHGGNIVSRKAAEKEGNGFGSHPVGTGPFGFAEHVTQQYLRLSANPNYFRGRPAIDTINIRMIAADNARELAFRSGELQLIAGKREQRWVDTMRRQPNTAVDIFQPGELRTLHLNESVKPLDDLRVRQAFAAAINVDDLLRFVGKDVATRACSVVPPGYLGEDCGAGPYVFSVEKAKALLLEAGYPNGIELNAVVSNVSVQLPIMQIIQSQLGKAGIKLNLNVVDHATYQSLTRKDTSAVVFYGAARFPTAEPVLNEFYLSKAAVNTPTAGSNFSHCRVADEEIEAANREPDPAKQKALWATAQRKIHDDVCAVPLFDLRQVWARSPRLVLGYTLTGSLSLGPLITEATKLLPP
jgi:peptide/nickel transport system substrate-binding protein